MNVVMSQNVWVLKRYILLDEARDIKSSEYKNWRLSCSWQWTLHWAFSCMIYVPFWICGEGDWFVVMVYTLSHRWWWHCYGKNIDWQTSAHYSSSLKHSYSQKRMICGQFRIVMCWHTNVFVSLSVCDARIDFWLFVLWTRTNTQQKSLSLSKMTRNPRTTRTTKRKQHELPGRRKRQNKSNTNYPDDSHTLCWSLSSSRKSLVKSLETK